MEDAQHALFLFHPADQFRSRLKVFYLYVIHMSVVLRALRQIRTLDQSLFLQRCKVFMIIIKDRTALFIDLVHLFKLCIQIRCIQIAWQIGGTIIYPGVLIDLTTEKFAAVRSFFS